MKRLLAYCATTLAVAVGCITPAMATTITHPAVPLDSLLSKNPLASITDKGLKPKQDCAENMVVIFPPSAGSISQLPEDIPFSGNLFLDSLKFEKQPDTVVKTLPYDALWPTGKMSYEQSVDNGVYQADKLISSYVSGCEDTTVHFYGFSEGADVAGRLVRDISADNGVVPAEKFGSAALVANPSRSMEDTVARAGNAPITKGLNETYKYGTLAPQVMEVCNAGDSVCDTSSVAPRLTGVASDPLMSNPLIDGRTPAAIGVAQNVNGFIHESGLAEFIGGVKEYPKFQSGWGIHGFSYYASMVNGSQGVVSGKGVDVPKKTNPAWGGFNQAQDFVISHIVHDDESVEVEN